MRLLPIHRSASRGSLAAAVLLALAAGFRAPAAEWELMSLDEIRDEAARAAGRLGVLAGQGVKALDGLELPTTEDWQAFWDAADTALHERDLAALAQLAPQAETALALLDEIPGAEGYADWLRQRLDYFEVAQEAATGRVAPPRKLPPPGSPVRITPPPRRPTTPPPVPPPTPPATPRPPPPRIRDPEVWRVRVEKMAVPRRAPDLVGRIKKVFREEGVPEQLVWLAEVESTMNPQARSPAGAAGLFQLMPPTARRFGLSTADPDQRLEPESSARAAARYLRFLHGRFGRWDLALAAYNAGEGRVGKALKDRGGRTFEDIADSLALETQMYVPKIDSLLRKREQTPLANLPAPARPG